MPFDWTNPETTNTSASGISGYIRRWSIWGKYCQNSDLKDYLDKLRKGTQWEELKNHRNAIAHYETGRADYQKISDLHRFAMEVLHHVWETGPQ